MVRKYWKQDASTKFGTAIPTAGRLKEVKLTDDTLERQYFIAYNKKKYLTGRMKEVLQVLKL